MLRARGVRSEQRIPLLNVSSVCRIVPASGVGVVGTITRGFRGCGGRLAWTCVGYSQRSTRKQTGLQPRHSDRNPVVSENRIAFHHHCLKSVQKPLSRATHSFAHR